MLNCSHNRGPKRFREGRNVKEPFAIPSHAKSHFKSRIKRFILGKKSRVDPYVPERESFHPKRVSRSPSPLIKNAPAEKPPEEPSPATNRREKVFQHSGKKNYFLEDAPVTLLPLDDRWVDGGFGIRITQKGKYVGQIISSQKWECRKLLVLVPFALERS